MMGKKVIVIGGGIAGLEAASSLAAFGIQVTLIEKEEHLGGHVGQWDRLFPSRRPAKEITGYLTKRLNEKVIVHTGTEVQKIEQSGKTWKILLNNSQTLVSDALLLATGFDLFEARKKEEYGYGIYDNVITSEDLEKKFAQHSQIRNAHGKVPERIGFVHCVGSRDEKVGNLYCSRVCCVTAVKQAVEVSEMIPGCEVFCFYMDLRMFGLDFEALYKESQEKWGVHFIRGRLSEAFENQDGSVLVKVEDTLAGRPLKMKVDLLVLMSGMVTSSGTKKLMDIMELETDENRFLQPADRQLQANETGIPGLFLAGTCTSPKSIDETIADSRAAALRIMEYLNSVDSWQFEN
ncbi:MAG: FAD-dependent oxidoreductase [Bacteroidales bacterium]|nr:FAD-dependent oxidoreductase [Bacteroidales bacterium]